MRFGIWPSRNQLAEYKKLRAAGKSLVSKILEHPYTREYDPVKVAKKLTLPVKGRTLLYADETDINAFADFMFHEFRLRGRTLIERCEAEEFGLSRIEAEMLQAQKHSHTSLFEALEAIPDAHQLRIRDLLEPRRGELLLTDIGFSECLARTPAAGLLFFVRTLTAKDIHMTSGVSFVFDERHKALLLRGYEERMKGVLPADWTEREFVFFYRKYRELGVKVAYDDSALAG